MKQLVKGRPNMHIWMINDGNVSVTLHEEKKVAIAIASLLFDGTTTITREGDKEYTDLPGFHHSVESLDRYFSENYEFDSFYEYCLEIGENRLKTALNFTIPGGFIDNKLIMGKVKQLNLDDYDAMTYISGCMMNNDRIDFSYGHTLKKTSKTNIRMLILDVKNTIEKQGLATYSFQSEQRNVIQ